MRWAGYVARMGTGETYTGEAWGIDFQDVGCAGMD
jgi:hypothetical protein